MPQIKRLLIQQASQELKEKISRLKTEIPSKLFKSDLDLLKRHYQLDRSYLSRLADWYAERPWWQKIPLAVVVMGGIGSLTAACYTLGFITVPTLILVNLLAVALYIIGGISLLTNHAAMEAKRFERVSKQVKRFEAELQSTIKSFQFIEERLTRLLEELSTQQDVLDHYAEELEEQVANLTQELSNAKNVITKLSETVETLQKDTASQQILEKELTGKLQTLQEVIVTDTTKAQKIDNQLTNNTNVLTETEMLLKSINQTLTVCDNAFKKKLDSLEEDINTTTTHAEKLDKDIEATPETITQSQILCQQVGSQLQQSLANDLEDQQFLAQFQQPITHHTAQSNFLMRQHN